MELESLADEQTLVIAILSITNPDPEILDRINPEDFADANTGELWSAARQVRDAGKLITPRNITRVRDNLPIRQRLKACEGHSANTTHITQAERTVTDLARRRRLHGALTASLERLEAATTYSEALENTHAELDRLTTATPAADVTWLTHAIDEWTDWTASPDTTPPIRTPWPTLNDKTAGGLHRGRTYVVGGRPGEGKSIAGANLALHAAENGHTAVMFSVEMGRREVVSRLIASGARANYGSITRRSIPRDDFGRIGEWIDSNRHIPLAIVDKPNVSVEYISATCRSIKRNRGLDVVFVDYLQLLRETDSKLARERQVAQMSRGLKILARELDVAVIIACQLNRNSANEKRQPTLADLRESGSIESDADVVILLHHPDDGDVDLVVAKNRTGPTCVVRQQWAAHQSRIA